jgi:plastocyanin
MSNLSKTVTLIVVVLVAILGVFFYLNKTGKLGAENVIADKTIVYNGSAFDPANVEIKVGESVAFVNRSATGMWVASAPHPTHTDYPGFDAKKSYGQGESYVFTFTKVGTWKFHNHMNPTAFGSITVK